MLFLLCFALSSAANIRRMQTEEISQENWEFPGCGFDEPADDELFRMQQEDQFLEQDWQIPRPNELICRFLPKLKCCRPSITIDVYLHNIQKRHFGTGRLTRSEIRSMIRQANSSFRSAGFRFDLRDINRVKNTAWYDALGSSAEETAMMTELKRGGVETLNIYVRKSISSDGRGVCGYANLAVAADRAGVRDGVTINHSCATDGKTTAHEIGKY